MLDTEESLATLAPDVPGEYDVVLEVWDSTGLPSAEIGATVRAVAPE